MGRVLVVDDEEGIREFLVEALELDDHEVGAAQDGQAALQSLSKRDVQVLLTDLSMPRMDGMKLIHTVRAEHPYVEIIVLTARGTVDVAVEAMKLGVFDFLQKPIGSPAELRLLVSRAVERHRLRALTEASEAPKLPALTYGAPAMVPVVHALHKVAKTSATVLLAGESGTGKEVAARTIHSASGRSGPFVAVNCAALSASLLESELFGHEKGAFTGAAARRRGKVELADAGTFFLDEVGELEPGLQAKLLRVLQERCFERVGGNQTVSVDVRWIAATNRDLPAMIDAGEFREDLYHRLAVFPIHLPALRDRAQDVPLLARALLRRIGPAVGRPRIALEPACDPELSARPWRGNVRELANLLERAAILADAETIGPELLEAADSVGGTSPQKRTLSATASAPKKLGDIERDAIASALARHEGNRTKAAAELDIGVRTLYDKIKRYGI